ncbi:MAG: hypothetical protein ABIO70_14545 [Pseudomonadota bacterium]
MSGSFGRWWAARSDRVWTGVLEKVIAACVMSALVYAVTFFKAHALYSALFGAGVFVGMWIEWARNKIARKVTRSFLLDDWPMECCTFVFLKDVCLRGSTLTVTADVVYQGPEEITITAGRLEHVRLGGRSVMAPMMLQGIGADGLKVESGHGLTVAFAAEVPAWSERDGEQWIPVFFGEDVGTANGPDGSRTAGFIKSRREKKKETTVYIAPQRGCLLVRNA